MQRTPLLPVNNKLQREFGLENGPPLPEALLLLALAASVRKKSASAILTSREALLLGEPKRHTSLMLEKAAGISFLSSELCDVSIALMIT